MPYRDAVVAAVLAFLSGALLAAAGTLYAVRADSARQEAVLRRAAAEAVATAFDMRDVEIRFRIDADRAE